MTTKLTCDHAMQAQLDRLVTGELAENDRRSLLAWLDEDAGRWRMCALAFLEAQLWEAAAAAPPAATPPLTSAPAVLARSAPTRRAWPRVFSAAAAAALLFLAGYGSALLNARALRPPATAQSELPRAAGPLMASVALPTNFSPDLPAQLQIPILPGSAEAPPAEALSDYERQQLERRGFEVHQELRYLPARLPDGTRVLVPVNKVQVKLKGTPVS
jgi:anti-sigma factor RsiW